jgi:glycogen debranching enzyme
MRERVAALYARNRQRGVARWAGAEYDFVCPSMETYPFQWFWDSCFHAIVLCHVDPARAESELVSLLANQQPDGFVAHVTFWQRERYEKLLETYGIAYRTRYLSDCIQPPLLAEAVRAVASRAGPGFLERMLPRLRRYYDWLDRMRDPDRDGLIAVVQADETGLDHSPKFDAYLGIQEVTHEAFCRAWERVARSHERHGRDHERMFADDRFIVEDVMVNTIYAVNLSALADLYERAGDPDEAREMRRRSDRTRASLLAKCWDDEAGLFFDLAGHRAECKLRTSTFTSLMPLVLPDLPRSIADRLIEHLAGPTEYWPAFPVPSVAMTEPSFVPGAVGTKLVWRGPTWINANWYLARGLASHGRPDLAAALADRSAALVESSGFREYYDPLTGEGHGAPDFSWSALVLDMLAEDVANQGRARPY